MLTPKRDERATVGEIWAEYADEMKPIKGLYSRVSVVGGLASGEPGVKA